MSHGGTYRIIRYYQDHGQEVIATGKTREEVIEHCNDPETSSQTCTTDEGLERTRTMGRWFDGYVEE